MKQTILFLSGLPGSGKTVFVKQYCEDNEDFERINKDDIRIALGDLPFSRQFEKKVLNVEREMGISILNDGKSLIVDDTNFSKKHWNFWKKIADSRNIEISRMFFATPLEVCIQRDARREKPVGKAAIQGMWEKHLKPKE